MCAYDKLFWEKSLCSSSLFTRLPGKWRQNISSALLVCSPLSSNTPPSPAHSIPTVASTSAPDLKPRSTAALMTSSGAKSYEEAVYQLNGLQSNAEILAKLYNRKQLSEMNVQETLDLLRCLDLTADKIDTLNCVHITGTKGKGSTAAFTESILRHLGFKTGFYSSPHLVHVRERVRINGKPVSEAVFAKYFFDIMNTIRKYRSEENLPGYFKCLTLLAFKLFYDEGVDVAIIEVGIGGEHDCTNVIQKPVVCGITSLDFGSTIEEIAWQKAGIMKKNSLLLTVDQPSTALEVIRQRSIEKQCPFHIVPNLEEYSWPSKNILFGIPGRHQVSNVSLALQLSRFWLLRTSKLDNCSNLLDGKNALTDLKNGLGFTVPAKFLMALENCHWPGRSQMLKKGNVTYFLDCAHTPQSINFCAEWFKEKSEDSKEPLRILIFHCTGERNSATLLPVFQDCRFDMALFCPVRLKPIIDKHNDNTSVNQSAESEIRKCTEDLNNWNQIIGKDCSSVFGCIEETLKYVEQLGWNNESLHVLVTGSLHLVGGVLYFECPDIAN